jgi:hypothetical protein
MSRVPLVLVFVSAVVSATAQPVARPTVTSRPPGTLDPQAAPAPPAWSLPLAREEAQTLRQRLQESLARQSALAPRQRALRDAGLPDESDAVEAARAAASEGHVGPIGIGLAQAPLAKPPVTVDPGLDAVTRLQLRARLDREPTGAEVEAELRAFDARIEQANRWLATHRTRVAKAYAAGGSLPPGFDDEAVRPGTTARRAVTPEERAAFRSLFRALLTQTDPAGDTPPADPQVPAHPGTGVIVSPTPRSPAVVVPPR